MLAESCTRRGSVRSTISYGSLIRETDWITCQACIHTFISHIMDVDNMKDNAVS